MKYDWKILSPVVLAFIFTACPETVPTPPILPSVAKITLETPSVLLENVGATQQLIAKAYDAQGNLVNTSIRWESSKPGNVSLDAGGLARGVAVGSSQLRATVGDVKSAPVVAAVGVLNENVARIPSDQVVSGPVFNNDCGPVDLGCQYTAVLKNVTPTAGKLWFSKNPDGMPVQGKIVSSQVVPEGTQVTFEVVSFQEIFKDLKVDESVDLPDQDLVVPAALKAAYDIQHLSDGSYQFTPRSKSALTQRLVFENSIVKCKGSLPPTTVTFGQPGFNLSLGSPRFELGFQVPIPFVTSGSARMLFTARPSVKITSGTHTINTNFNNQSLTCTFKNGISQSFSALGFAFKATLVPGLSVGGSFGAGSLGFSAQFNANANIRFGFDCRPPAGCTDLSSGNGASVQGLVNLSSTGNLAATIRDLKAGVFADLALSVEAPIVGSLNIYNDRTKYDMAFDLASLKTQISDNNPADYSISRSMVIDPLASLNSLIHLLLGKDAGNILDPITINLASVQSPLITSATVTSQTRLAVNVNATLDPNRLNFFNTISPFGLIDNVGKVQLIGVTLDGTPQIIAEVIPASNATSVNLSVSSSVWESFFDHQVTIIPVILNAFPVGTLKVQ
jgi:hypothetical protein